MDTLSRYNIQWKGLSNGKHSFEFGIDDAFFEAFEDSEIEGGKLTAKIELTKSATMLVLDVTIRGEVTVQCDRCLGELQLPVDYNGTLTVKFSDEIDDYDGEIMWINPADGELRLAQYIYESIVLSLPYQKVHGTDANGNLLCDADMLSRFRIVSQEEFDAFDPESRTLAESPESDKLEALKRKLEERE